MVELAVALSGSLIGARNIARGVRMPEGGVGGPVGGAEERVAHRRARRDAQRVGEDGGWCLPDEFAPGGQPARPGGDAELVGEWEYEVSKVELAKALWPTLVHKIQARMVSAAAPVPPIAEVVQGAYHTAQRWRYQSYVLSVKSYT